jgi:hypothetical protein
MTDDKVREISDPTKYQQTGKEEIPILKTTEKTEEQCKQ